MSKLEYLALGLELWTAIGLLGLAISLARRERRKLLQGVSSLVGVWLIYLCTLWMVSHRQPEERVTMGKPSCFHTICYTVERVEEVPAQKFSLLPNARLLRVVVHVQNRGKEEAHEALRAYLRDAQGRRWAPSNAVSGNSLSGRMLPGATIVSEPVFQVAKDATGLTMMLTHGRWSRHALVIGDPESLWHRPRVMMLENKEEMRLP
jgi:hypothetical protein